MNRAFELGPAAAVMVIAVSALTACGSSEPASSAPPSTAAALSTVSPAPSSAATAASSTPANEVVLDDAVRASLQTILETGLEKSGMPGVAAYVRIGDDIWESSAGVGDLSTEEPFDADAVVRIASNTKPFTATAVLQLVDQGKVSLDDPIETFVPGITNGTEITVRDLLQMSSGIWEFTADADVMGRWSADLMMPWTTEQSIELIKGKPAQFEPGEKVVYTDSNYILLGAILEKVTGQDAAEVINSAIVEPLALSSTHFPTADEPNIPDPHQQGYRPPGEQLGDVAQLQPVGDINPQVAWTAGAMTSTLDDLTVWADALADGELLSPELQAQRLESRKFDGQAINFGYGLGVIRLNDFVGHDGAIVGYSSVAMRYPAADATFVLVGNASTNSTTPTMDIFLDMVKELYPQQLR